MDPDELARRVRDLVVDDAVARRARRASRRAATDELASIGGLLLSAAHRGEEVGLSLLGGQQVRLVPSLVGPDVVAGARRGAPTDLVALRAIAAVDLGAAVAADPDSEHRGPTLHDVLTAIVDERPPVAVWTTDGSGPQAGDLRSCGVDVIVLSSGATSRRAIPLESVARIRVAP